MQRITICPGERADALDAIPPSGDLYTDTVATIVLTGWGWWGVRYTDLAETLSAEPGLRWKICGVRRTRLRTFRGELHLAGPADTIRAILLALPDR